MPIESLRRPAVQLCLAGVLGLLTACPGELKDKADFEAYAASHPDAGAPSTTETGGSDASGNAGSSTSSGSSGSSGTGPSDTCGDVIERIFVPSCAGTGCHGDTSPQQDLDLVTPDVKARLVGVPGKQCLELLIDLQSPEQSLLYKKLLVKPDCGAQMPLARPPLSAADIACVLAWIAAP